MSTRHLRWSLVPLALTLMAGALLPGWAALAAAPSTAVVSRGFWDYDSALWGDGRPHAPIVKGQPNPYCWLADYDISVPATGWYQLVFKSGDFRHDLLVDGHYIYRYRAVPQVLPEGWRKAVNLMLTAGKHTLRIQRLGLVGFPGYEFDRFELRAADNRPQNSVSSTLSGFDAVRVGENVTLSLTSGYLTAPARYEVARQDLQHPDQAAEIVGAVTFPAGQTLTTKTVEIPCPQEGVFRLSGRLADGTALGDGDFHQVDYVVIDTKTFPGPAETQKTLVDDLDCVAQTDMGKPIDPSRFFECNGKTRITETAAGRYRESNNCTGPEVEKIPSPLYLPRTYSGFAYELTLPQAGVPYMMELDYPDDARRAMAVPLSYLKEDGSREAVSAGYSGKSVETGGFFPLTHTMLTQYYIFWPYTREINVGLLSQEIGYRAAASHIRIYQYAGELPVTPDNRMSGRTFADWYEEGGNWHLLVEGDQLQRTMPEIVADYLALNRWIRLARLSGMTAMNAPAVSYQGAFFPTKTLDGYGPLSYSQIRLTALLCEKYRMRYIPEVFPAQWYRTLVEWPRLVSNPRDIKNISAQGLVGGQDTAGNVTNCLHPAVQQAWVDTFKEIGDQLRDSPAFGGITIRLDGWQWEGDWCLSSLLWGYGDYNIALFEHDTGITVPGAPADPNRFEQRYQFLTTGAMRDRWINWRCQKVLDYQRRLREAFAGPRQDVTLYMVGDGYMDPLHDERVFTDPVERFREAGVDPAALRGEPGIALIPGARYGSRNTGVAERATYDGFFDKEYVDLGMNRERGFAAYMVYQELGGSLPFDKLGVIMKNYYYCSGIDAAGRNSLEKYAAVLAEQDSSLLRDGGNSYIFGSPPVYGPWMSEYNALPRADFTPLAEATDPVAVWQYAGSAGHYFYAINREQYPVTIALSLQGAPAVTDLGTGETLALPGGVLHLALEPYALRSFRAPGGATLLHAVTTVPPERVEFVKDRLVFAQQVAEEITTGDYQRNVAAADRETYLKQLAEAWTAFGQGHYWRARVLLFMAPMMQVYESVSGLPGQVVSSFPNLLSTDLGGFYALPRPMLDPSALISGLPEADRPALVDSSTLNPEWGGSQVAMAKDGRLDLALRVPSDGPYHLAVGYVTQSKGALLVALDGQSLPQPIVAQEAGVPSTMQFPVTTLAAGTRHLTITGNLAFGVYGMRLVPVLRPIPSSFWATVGPFTTDLSNGAPELNATLTKVMTAQYGPETQPNLDAVFHDSAGAELKWTLSGVSYPGTLNDRGVDFALRCHSPNSDICFAQTFITAPHACDLLVLMGTDWWANLYLNGQVVTTGDTKLAQDTGSWFNSKYFAPAVLPLQAGVNRLLVKNQAGSMGNSFMLYALDRPDITFAATTK